MSIIRVSDKDFAPFIPQEKIENEIHRIASEIKRDMMDKEPLFLVMLNGAFMFAAELFKSLDMPCEMAFVKYKTCITFLTHINLVLQYLHFFQGLEQTYQVE